MKAEQVKKQHLENNPGYQYQPRKPSEKKKRMTRNKATVSSPAAPAHDHTDMSFYHSPETGSTVSHGSPLSAMTPSSQGSPSDQKYMEMLMQAHPSQLHKAEYLAWGVLPDFPENQFAVSSYDPSQLGYDGELLGPMMDKHNVSRDQTPPLLSNNPFGIDPSELHAPESLCSGELSTELVAALSQAETTPAISEEDDNATSKLIYTPSKPAGILDVEYSFDYDLLESHRNDILDNEVSQFEHEYLNSDSLS